MTETKSIVIERVMPHAPEKIWRALTSSEHIAAWLMQNDFQAKEGHNFTFRAKPIPGWSGITNCVVLKVDPPRLLSYSWGDGTESDSGLKTVVTWTLTPEGKATRAHGTIRFPAPGRTRLHRHGRRLAAHCGRLGTDRGSHLMKHVTRYHPALVALHWLVAVLIVGMLGIGFFWLAARPNTDPDKIDVLRVHMATGMGILALMIIRFIVRMRTARPPDAHTGIPALNKLQPIAHYGLYLIVVAMVGTGYATGILAGLPDIVFAQSGDPLPEDFTVYPTMMAHFYIAIILVAFLVVHILAAFYHQFIRQDGLFSRMWFGKRDAAS